MKNQIKKIDLEDEYYFREGCHIVEVSNSDSDEEVSIARARVEPNMTTAWHCLKQTTERYVILSGEGSVEIGDLAPTPVATGDVVIIPQQVRQRIQNTGQEDLIFLAICSPRFQEKNYTTLE